MLTAINVLINDMRGALLANQTAPQESVAYQRDTKNGRLNCELTKLNSSAYDGREAGLKLDENLKQLMKELGAAINDALSDSEEISEAIQNVRNAGYDVFLVLEATIGFNKRKSDGALDPSVHGLKPGEMKLKVTAQDLKFLRSLKISVEDLDQQS